MLLLRGPNYCHCQRIKPKQNSNKTLKGNLCKLKDNTVMAAKPFCIVTQLTGLNLIFSMQNSNNTTKPLRINSLKRKKIGYNFRKMIKMLKMMIPLDLVRSRRTQGVRFCKGKAFTKTTKF